MLKYLFLGQFCFFGNLKRVIDSGFTTEHLTVISGIEVSPEYWIFEYFVSVGFYTLTEFSKVEISKGAHKAACKWWPINDLPPMMFDH